MGIMMCESLLRGCGDKLELLEDEGVSYVGRKKGHSEDNVSSLQTSTGAYFSYNNRVTTHFAPSTPIPELAPGTRI